MHLKDKKIVNIDQIMKVRINNVLALADKKEKEKEEQNFEKLKNYTFDQEIGYLVCNLLDSKIRVASQDFVLLSFEYSSAVEQNLLILDKLNAAYNKILKNKKKIIIVTSEEWEKIKNEYIINLKNNYNYEVLQEPAAIYEESDKNDIIVNDAVELFGDIVEFE